MADILTPAERSALLARVRSAGNASTELRLVALLRAGGITGWRRGCRLQLRGQKTDDGRQRTEVAGDRWQAAKGGGGKDSPRSARRQDHRGHAGSTAATSVSSVVQIRRPTSVIGRPLAVRPDFVFRRARLVVLRW